MQTQRERGQYGNHSEEEVALNRIIGVSPAIQSLRESIRRISQYSVTVLITGPTGTGKEVVARAIHNASARRRKPFIPVDCAAVTGTLFASHMFGHHKGAFTGATYSALGCFRAADGGAIFLDEIGEMELSLQAKLLRVLQQNTVAPVGGHEETPVDVTVVAATNRDLAEEVSGGRFREDLYYRLNVMQLRLPPLAERREDIPPLVSHFLDELAVRHGAPRKTVSPEALAILSHYDWPGNVRQLQNALERLTLLARGETITSSEASSCLDSFAPPARAESTRALEPHGEAAPARPAPPPPSPDALPGEGERRPWRSLEDIERRHIHMTLKRTFYNQTAAAELLQIDRSALRRRIAKLGLELPQPKRGRPRKPR